MELVQEIIVTVSVALLLSFIVAKLVSMAVGGDGGRGVGLESGESVETEVLVAAAGAAASMEEMKFGDRLRVGGSEGETRVDEFVVHETKKVDQFEFVVEGGKSAEVADRSTETSRVGEVIVGDCSELQENLVKEGEIDEEEEESDVVELADTLSAENLGEEVVMVTGRIGGVVVEECSELQEKLVEEESKVDDLSAGNSGEEKEVKVDGIGLESKIDDSVDDQSEEIKVEELIDTDSDEDDWEGIERSELEEEFAAAAAFVVGGGGEKDGRLENVGSDVLMQLYGLHKIATEGTCYEPQPMALKMSARAKWY